MENRPTFQPDFNTHSAPAHEPVCPAGTDGDPSAQSPGEASRWDSLSPVQPALTVGEQAEDSMFARSLGMGVAAMLVGALFHAAESSYSGLHFIYLAFVPGLLVGRAMKWKESVPGGRRYQIAAVTLTYASYTLAALLQILWVLRRRNIGLGDIGLAGWGRLLARSIQLPFLEATDGFTGWIELAAMAVGIYIAWKSTRHGAAVMRSRWERRRLQDTPPSITGR